MAARSWSKWSKHLVLRQQANIASALPETVWMTEASFNRMLNKYSRVVAKPTQKWGGQGVTFIKRLGSSKYQIQADRTKKIISGKKNTWIHTNRIKKSPHYIVQQYVNLAQVNKRPFDIRVMLQRRGNSPWAITGKLAKIAGPGWLVTNALRSHGSITTVSHALIHSSDKLNASKKIILARIDSVSRKISVKLGRSYPQIRTVGLDLGVDKQGHVWLIEANFTPMLGLFNKLKDKRMYRRMTSFR